MRTICIARTALCLVLLFAVGCNPFTAEDDAYVDSTLVKSAVNRDSAPDVSEADFTVAADAVTAFTLNAFPQLEPDTNTNAVFSPYSITLALALAAAGAQGTTLSQMETAMSFSLPQERLAPAFNKLDLLLASKTTGTVYQDNSQSPKLNIANAVWAQDGYTLLPSYLDFIALNYGAGLHVVDYIQAPEAARQTINSWVSNKTNNRIPELLSPDSISSLTRVVLTNAIWFKGNWASKFPVENTANRTFINHDASEAVVSCMARTGSMPAAGNGEYQTVDIPYVDGNLSMLLIMPAPGTFDAFLAALTPDKLNSVVDSLTYYEVALTMPRFSFSSELSLRTLLTSLGMNDAFNAAMADFSGITGNHELFMQDVIHKAFINVDENGTEAAAATAVTLIGTSAPPPPSITVTVDHPFLFMLRDRQTGLILFMGKVVTL